MLSKSESKFIKSLQLKKYRKESGRFIVEGRKNIIETLQSNLEIDNIYVTQPFLNENHNILGASKYRIEIVSEKELSNLGSFQSNSAGLAIVQIPESPVIDYTNQNFFITLDDIRDPGNLGTIIRIADWFNLPQVICSESCADSYNPKVINASMGSFCRISCHYTNLKTMLENATIPVIGTSLKGINLHDFSFPRAGYILMGNESTGIKPELLKTCSQTVQIPRLGKAESLNVAVATAILCDNLFRKS
ncbi:MAG: RNA methyltransferase [Bacteroidetes bacterium]|nr:RNA methyltransferase [Bacteroidota bacterium]MDA1121071.1 RNA methyltransferase [Bacteroidota bacterium]